MKQFYTIILILVGLNLQGQEYLRPLDLDGIQPSWQQFIIDSTTINDPKKYGFNHLTTTFILVEESPEIAYFIHWDFGNRYEGALIQKRNVKSGEILWSSVYNLSNSDRHEFPRSAFLDKNGDLAIVNLRNNDPDFTTFVWFKASPALRVYDKDSGQLIDYIHSNEPITDVNQILFYTGLSNTLTISNELKFNFIEIKTNSKYYTTLKTYTETGKFEKLIIDTIESSFPYFNYSQFHVLKSNDIFTFRHNHNQRPQAVFENKNFDQYNYTSVLYSSDYSIKTCTDLTGVFPYNWKIDYSGDNGQEYWLVCGDSTEIDLFTIKSSKALVFVSLDGKVNEIIDFGDNKYERIYAVKETDSEGAYIVTQDFIQKLDSLTNEYVSEIIFWKSDGKGNLTRLHTLKHREDRTLTISSVSLIGNNLVLGTYMRKYELLTDLFPKYQMKGLIGYNIGRLTASNDILINEPRLILFPNPATDHITLSGLSHSSQVHLYATDGRHIGNPAIHDDQIDVSQLPTGLYFIRVSDGARVSNYKFMKQ